MGTVAEVIAAQSARYDGQLSAIHEAIHGTADPVRIERQIRTFADHALGSPVRAGLFHQASAGSVTGLELDDGRQVVVKAYQPRWTRVFLDAVVGAQAALADAGLACARPVAGPNPFEDGWATVETMLADPGQPASFGRAELRVSAQGLASLISVLASDPERAGLHDNPLHQPFEGLYPKPHSPLFDFEATRAGAEWIDELAAVARPLLDRGPRVVAHTDWSARNVRLSSAGVRAIYDLDSLAVVPLPAALSQAAVTWRSTAEPGDGPAPGVEEVEAWLREYPESLTVAECRDTFAHVLYHLCYSSRCEHAVDPDGHVHQRARPTLRSEADELLRRIGGP